MIPKVSTTVVIEKPALQQVFDNLRASGFELVGPTIRNHAIVLDHLDRIDELPVGWTDVQYPGRYELKETAEKAFFGFTTGPHSWKRFLHPARQEMMKVRRQDGSFEVESAEGVPTRYALIGARACDLAAIGIQDHIFLGDPPADPGYHRRREEAFVLAVNCTDAGEQCFCASMGTGPRIEGGFDLALVELHDAFVVEVGSEAGSEALHDAGWKAATAFDLRRADEILDIAGKRIRRTLRTDDLPRMIFETLDHPHWSEIAERCVGCGNCTMVCPTCFCTNVDDTVSIDMKTTKRVRAWDSCTNLEFSHVFGGNARPTVRSRHRQWVTHKYGSWVTQFGVLGCVGCGRCSTWCPVGIDITEELDALRSTGAK